MKPNPNKTAPKINAELIKIKTHVNMFSWWTDFKTPTHITNIHICIEKFKISITLAGNGPRRRFMATLDFQICP